MHGRGSRRYFFPTIGVAGGGLSIAGRIQSIETANLISYKILGEASGTVAVDQINSAMNGTHNNVTLAQQGIGGYTSASYNGTTSNTLTYTAALAAAFNGAAGTIIAYAKPSGASIWTDGAARYVRRLFANSNNQIRIYKSTSNNTIYANYTAGGTSNDVSTTAFGGNTSWMFLAITWDKNSGATGEVKFYGNVSGTVAQIGTTQTSLGTWSGAIADNYTSIGSAATTPIASPWSGLLQHMPIYTKALTLAELQIIYGNGT
jgi:hypothetical protein